MPADFQSRESDETLLMKVGEGEEAALRALYARYGSVVWGFILTRVDDYGLSEEINSDVWLGCWRSARAFRSESRVLTWLLGIAKRQIYVRVRRKKLPMVSLDDAVDELPTVGPNPADIAISSAGAASLIAALQSLPEDVAEIVRLAWLYELSYQEISEIADIPVGTVKSRVFRARRLLIKQLEENANG